MRGLEWKKGNNQVMDELFKSPTRQSVASPVIVSKSGSKEMAKTIAFFFYENGISFNFADTSSFAHMIEESMISQTNSPSKL